MLRTLMPIERIKPVKCEPNTMFETDDQHVDVESTNEVKVEERREVRNLTPTKRTIAKNEKNKFDFSKANRTDHRTRSMWRSPIQTRRYPTSPT